MFEVMYKTQTWLSPDSHSNASVSCVHVENTYGYKMKAMLLPGEYRLIMTDCKRSIMIDETSKKRMITIVIGLRTSIQGFLDFLDSDRPSIDKKVMLNPKDRHSPDRYFALAMSGGRVKFGHDEYVFQILKNDKVMLELHANYIYEDHESIGWKNTQGFYNKLSLLDKELEKYLIYLLDLE